MVLKLKTRRWKRAKTIRKGGRVCGYVITTKKQRELRLHKEHVESILIRDLPPVPCYTESKVGHLYLIEEPANYAFAVIRTTTGDILEVELEGLEPQKNNVSGE